MVARLVTPLGGRTVAFFSLQKPVDQRAVIVWSDMFTQDDLSGNFYAQGSETRVRIGKTIITTCVIGQHSNLYLFPRKKKGILGTTYSCDFFGRKVVVSLFQEADDLNVPIFAVLKKNNPWMEQKEYTIPDAFFRNLMQLKHFVSQASVITLGSAYQLFLNDKGVEIGEVLERINLNRRNLCRVWLQSRNRIPTKFVNPDNSKEHIDIFLMENETFPRRKVVAAIPFIGKVFGSDTLDLRRFLQWRAMISPTKLGRPLITWVR